LLRVPRGFVAFGLLLVSGFLYAFALAARIKVAGEPVIHAEFFAAVKAMLHTLRHLLSCYFSR
jgi:hypothetical protein